MKIVIFVILCFFQVAWAQPHPPIELLIQESNLVQWEKGVTQSLLINAPIEEVWKYASNSHNAHDWSVFFDHISPLPGIPDGQVGSLRRCFRHANELGPFWDEVVVTIQPQRMRIITTYNLNHFPLNDLNRGQYVFVRQLYEPIDKHTTRMTFQTMTRPGSPLLNKMIFRINKKSTSKIFKENLLNIKAIIEGYPRVYSWY